ncbi:helix-turn-helix domain-containing protein [Agrobacterium vitis]|uniref:helix-turn-helix domain-containing protein n=1 Tax=Agrobacterium vitis TaxID=373 RepID=UPI0012E8217A|nr:AraC family transcriptional regulator [Agrobacterium vitis]MCF1470132.1 helix-turn-helix transcriptional regulator [Agrobacterium vitis]MVA82464.1 helix-turn-helix domain-containing protein [Agrobacterium vitis]
MLFIPLPIVIAILLLVLFIVAIRHDDEGRPPNIPFLALILVSVLQSLLVGLRWGYGVQAVMYVSPVVAATIPPLVYAGVCQLIGRAWFSLSLRVGVHALSALLIAVLTILWRDAIDMALALIFVSYVVAILLLVQPGADALRLAALDEAGSAYHAILLAAGALVLSALGDAFIFLDMEWMHGQNAPLVIMGGQLASLIILSVAVAAMGRSRPIDGTAEVPEVKGSVSRAENAETMMAIQTYMQENAIYRDCDLTLDRLARRICIPARQISIAINEATGKNVSQYVNAFRISEACDLLSETKKPVTEIMLEVGFQTKSNFNREFRRSTDMTPLEWRKNRASGGKAAR